jgi:hypothetical protein
MKFQQDILNEVGISQVLDEYIWKERDNIIQIIKELRG